MNKVRIYLVRLKNWIEWAIYYQNMFDILPIFDKWKVKNQLIDFRPYQQEIYFI